MAYIIHLQVSLSKKSKFREDPFHFNYTNPPILKIGGGWELNVLNVLIVMRKMTSKKVNIIKGLQNRDLLLFTLFYPCFTLFATKL